MIDHMEQKEIEMMAKLQATIKKKEDIKYNYQQIIAGQKGVRYTMPINVTSISPRLYNNESMNMDTEGS